MVALHVGAGATVLDDGVEDKLKGGSEFDWFFANLDGDDDDLMDLKVGEVLDLL